MPNKLSEQLKKQAALYLSNGMGITAKRKFEKELQSNLTLKTYLDDLKYTIETTREFSTLRPSDELLQGSRNLLKGKLQQIESKQTTGSAISILLEKLRNGIASVFKVKQPVWAVATYIIIGLIAGRLLLAPYGDDTALDLNGNGSLDMNKIIDSGLLTDLQIDQSTLSPSSVKFVSNVDNRFNVSGSVNDKDVKKIIYYLLLNDKEVKNRLEAGKLINRMTPNNETQMVLISSVLSESDTQVKLQSIKTLNSYQSTPDILNACKKILLDERNADIRLEALSILEKNKSSDLIPLLEVVSEMDEDRTVKNKASKLLGELQKPISIENKEVTK
jgi:hypothetical protein